MTDISSDSQHDSPELQKLSPGSSQTPSIHQEGKQGNSPPPEDFMVKKKVANENLSQETKAKEYNDAEREQLNEPGHHEDPPLEIPVRRESKNSVFDATDSTTLHDSVRRSSNKSKTFSLASPPTTASAADDLESLISQVSHSLDTELSEKPVESPSTQKSLTSIDEDIETTASSTQPKPNASFRAKSLLSSALSENIDHYTRKLSDPQHTVIRPDFELEIKKEKEIIKRLELEKKQEEAAEGLKQLELELELEKEKEEEAERLELLELEREKEEELEKIKQLELEKKQEEAAEGLKQVELAKKKGLELEKKKQIEPITLKAQAPEVEAPRKTTRLQVYGSTISGNRTYKTQIKQAFNILKAHEIEFEFICIAADQAAKSYMRRKALGNMTLPQFYVDKEFVGLFDEFLEANESDCLEEWLGLDQEPLDF